MNNEQRFPLAWPAGFKRTQYPTRSGFNRNRSMDQATKALLHELKLLGAEKVILSTNLELRLDGLPRSNQRQPTDKGVAVYFTMKGRKYCFPCDAWDRIEDNVHAIAKHVEAMRGQRRWSVGSVEAAFAGYVALPGPTAEKPWHEVLKVKAHAPTEDVVTAYKTLSMTYHPDRAGGSHQLMSELNAAYQAFKKERGIN